MVIRLTNHSISATHCQCHPLQRGSSCQYIHYSAAANLLESPCATHYSAAAPVSATHYSAAANLLESLCQCHSLQHGSPYA